MLIPGTTFSDYTPKIDYEKLYLDLVKHINKKAQELGITEDNPSLMVDHIVELTQSVLKQLHQWKTEGNIQ